MAKPFGELLRRLRREKGLSQEQLADQLHVERTSLTNWEKGRRMPDAAKVFQIGEALGVDAGALMANIGEIDEVPNVLLVDDEPIILSGGLPVLREVLPGANVIGFTSPREAMDYCRENPAALVFLDIEMGMASGLVLCQELLQVKPRTNVVYLTAFREYSLDAWDTGACGFLLKPLDAEEVRVQLRRLRYPVRGLL